MLRIEVQGTLARHFLMPGLPDFFAHYPDIEITMSEGDRYVDIVREGVDCVLRFGALPDSDMVARRIGLLRLTVNVDLWKGCYEALECEARAKDMSVESGGNC
jgi:DNA-binding transcriptional LysR family regulator